MKAQSENMKFRNQGSLNKKSIENISEIYKIFFENSLDAMMIGSQDGLIYKANPAACRMLGFSEKEICKLGRKGILEQTPQVTEAVRKRRKTGNYFGELILIKKDRAHFPVEISSSVFTNSDGKEFTTLIIRDITKNKNSEELLRQSHEWQRSIFEGSLDAIFISDENSVLIAVNKAACDLTGYSREELLKMRIPDLHDEPDLEAYRKYNKRIFKGEKILSEARILRKDGIKIDTEFNNSRISISGKLFMHTTARDITERKINEEKIETSEAEYRSLFENSIMSISQTYPGGGYMRINKAYANLYGYSDIETMLKEVSGNTTKLYSNPDNRKKVIEILEKEGYMHPTEFELIRHNGEKFWALVSAKQVKDDTGKLLYLQAEHIDITERKKMEEELRKSHELLEKLNQHLVEAIENERNQIALNLHDDLGQKLTAINLDIAWLKSRIGVQSKTVREKFEEMSRMIIETIESIKETSSFLRPAILFDLGLASAIKSQLGSFERQTGIKCTYHFKPEEFLFEDKLSLIFYRILQESLTNIARHSGASSTDVSLYVLKNKIELTIKDNGSGIEKNQVNSLKSMGIAGIKERVKSVNGKMTIVGAHGSGTMISVEIPLSKVKTND